MPPAPDPTTLHQAFTTTHPLDWGPNALSAADIANLHGTKATRKSLQLLERAAAIEPQITSQFLAAVPPTASPYHLDRRVKSPESLARKLRNEQGTDVRGSVDDLLRFTVLTATPDELVTAALQTVDKLTGSGWRVTFAVHSYSDGSRYKGIHAYLKTPDSPRIEVQVHSVASIQVKELTTPWYEVERSRHATDDERGEARRKCVEASAQLEPPPGIDHLASLGGRPVAVHNYSDSRQKASALGNDSPRDNLTAQGVKPKSGLNKNDGIAR
ncbi:hypothetical protein [Kribbella sp. NPDC055071]